MKTSCLEVVQKQEKTFGQSEKSWPDDVQHGEANDNLQEVLVSLNNAAVAEIAVGM